MIPRMHGKSIHNLQALMGVAVTCLGSVPAFAHTTITFLEAGQADAAVVQIEQDAGEPFTIIVDGDDGDSDLEDNLPGLLAVDPTIELVVLN
jgi:hypothetical protein